MLQALNEKITGWLGWIIIGLIIVTFALFGLGSYLQDKARAYAARVNDVEISTQQLQRAYQQQRARLERMLGDAYDPARIDEDLLRKRALDVLIQRVLLLQEAERQGLTISDAYLAAFIHAIPELQEDGKFSKKRYQRILFQQGLTPAAFEADTRQRLLVSQLVDGVGRTTLVTPRELGDAWRLQAQKRDFAYLIVAAAPFEATASVDDADVQAYYDSHRAEFVAPEKVRIDYLRLRLDDLAKQVEVTEDELRAEYEARKTTLASEEQRRASHILIAVDADADAATREAARRKAQEILERARAGEDFAVLAKKYSADKASAAKGGDLGFFGKGVMMPAFEKAVFGMQKGQVSDIVETDFGYHIIMLTDIRGSSIPSFEKARAELEKDLRLRKAEDLFYDRLEQLTDLAYENPESLQPAADALGLEVKESDWLTASGGPGVGRYRNLMEAVFSDDVLEAGNNTEPVEVGANDVIVARVHEREPSRPQTLDEVRERIVALLRAQQAREAARSKGEALLKEIEGGRSMKALEEAGHYAFREAKQATRTAPGHDPRIVREAFRLRVPAEGSAELKGLQLANGDYVIIRLTGVTEADPKAMKADERRQLLQGFIGMRENALFNALVDSLRAKAEIDIPEESE